ncbi:MAG: CotH kinase family protein [Clostridiales bacterium]|nr:CotH kinase family protein [Clostridiales bacterium]
MKKILIIILIMVMAFTGCSVSDDTAETKLVTETVSELNDYLTFFSDDEIHEIHIDISDEDFTDILNNALDEEYHEATITLDGVTLSSVGFRTKGNSTLRQVAESDSERYSFKIKANEYEDQDLLGLDEFVLNNMFSDASYLREHLSYEAMSENGLNVPLSSFANVYVNDELYGLYLLVESVDDSFLDRNFGDNEGNLYRADQGTSLAITDGEYIENVSQKNGDDDSKTDLYEFMDILNAMPEGEKGDIESVLDVESALRYIATNTLLENYDSLNGQHQQNYYLYNDNNVFVVIPWDYNMSFGGFGGAGQSTVDIDNPISGITESSPLIENLLSVDEYRELYYNILEDYMDYFTDFEDEVTELADMIRESVDNDPTKFTTMALFESNVVFQEGGAVEVAVMQDMKRGTPPEEGKPNEEAAIPPRDQNTQPPNGGRMNGKADNIQIGNDVSIINVLLARIENIKLQLSEK